VRARALAGNSGINSGAGRREVMERIIALHEQALAKDPRSPRPTRNWPTCMAACIGMKPGSIAGAPGARGKRSSTPPCGSRRPPETRLALGAYAYYCDNEWSRALVEFHAAEDGAAERRPT